MDCGPVNLRCASGTCGGARVGIVQALAGLGERCGLLELFLGVAQGLYRFGSLHMHCLCLLNVWLEYGCFLWVGVVSES